MCSSKAFAFMLFMIFEAIADETIVNLKYGKVRGIIKKNVVDGSEYTALLGIPYTLPITEKNKFADSEQVKPWGDKILDATKYGSNCLDYQLNGKINCLFINIYIPGNAKKGALSSMLWIHGGTYVSGSGDDSIFGPDFLLRQNVIIATINFRLGPFGYFSAGSPLCPGNMAFKDQNMAIKFFKEILPDIGGDPNQITIFGDSSGSISVSLQVLSPLSVGLFRRAIQESGTGFDTWAFNSEDAELKVKLMKKVFNLTSTSASDICKELTNKFSAEEIIKNLYSGSADEILARVFYPTYEYCPNNCKIFLPEHPRKMMIKGNFNKVPILVGMNADETAEFTSGLKEDFDNHSSDDPRLLLNLLPPETPSLLEDVDSFPRKFFEFYTGKPKIGGSTEQITLMFTDITFIIGMIGAVNFHTLYGVTVYGYYFQHRTITERKKLLGLTKPSCIHTDDLFYSWYARLLNNTYEKGTDDYNVSKFFVETWTNFAKYGDPTPNLSDLSKWLTYKESKSLMKIDKDPKLSKIADIEKGYLSRICWWLSVFKKEYRVLFTEFNCDG